MLPLFSGALLLFRDFEVPFMVVAVDEAVKEDWSSCPGIVKGGTVGLKLNPFASSFDVFVISTERLGVH